jgi:hypothetical protein
MRKLSVVLLFAAVASGCGPAYEYHVGKMTITADLELCQDVLDWNVQQAQIVLHDFGPKISETQFHDAFDGVSIHVMDTEFWHHDGQVLWGETQNWATHIELTTSTISLTHEFLHVWDFWHADRADETANHDGWEELGYYAATDSYEDQRSEHHFRNPNVLYCGGGRQ